jgi:hypothetical protein
MAKTTRSKHLNNSSSVKKRTLAMPADAERFKKAIQSFDAANADDLHLERVDGVSYPKELLYAQRMTTWLDRFAPDASEALRLAARCQHIRRWMMPRSHYPMDRRGYLQWRTALAKFHADTAADILREVGYGEALICRVQSLLRKEGLKRDPEVQCLEDVICLVFLESYCADFATHHNTAKMLPIIRKTWEKMSPHGREVARTLDLPQEVHRLVEAALAAEYDPL